MKLKRTPRTHAQLEFASSYCQIFYDYKQTTLVSASLLFPDCYFANWRLPSVQTAAHLPAPASRPPSQPQAERAAKGLGRNRTIKISRATRVSKQWNASLDREITNANELRHLDEFLGNQVILFPKERRAISTSARRDSSCCNDRSSIAWRPKQVNDFRSRGKQLSATEAIFVTATMQFRETIKAMYSLPVSVCI